MVSYLAIAKKLIAKFKNFLIQQSPQAHHFTTDALARLASTKDVDFVNTILVERLRKPSTLEEMNEIEDEPQKSSWMTPIQNNLQVKSC